MFVRGALGKAGRKRSRRATRFLGGQGGFLTASSVMAAVGVAWGIYDSLRQQQTAAAVAQMPAGASGGVPPPPTAPPLALPDSVARVVRLAASAANADGTLSAAERVAIDTRAREAGVALPTDEQLLAPGPLADIVAGVSSDQERRDLYVLAFAIVRADESVTGAERIYLAQLAHALGLDAATASAIERDTAAAIDASGGAAPA